MEEKLRELLSKNKVIPFVGAGVSKEIRDKEKQNVFLSWEELLKKLAESESLDNSKQTAVKALLDVKPINYLMIADLIEEYMSKNDFNKEMKEIFDIDYNNIDDESYDLAKAIWELKCNLVITTNYDKVLFQACDNKNICHWDIEANFEQSNYLRNGVKKPTVWNLHGHADRIDSIILTSHKYNEFYTENTQDSKYKSALETLRNVISSHSLLFIGFSLDDKFFLEQIERTLKIFGGNSGEHYVLVKEGKRPNTLDGNIKVIEFEDYGTPLIEKIRSLKAQPSMAEVPKSDENNDSQEKEKPQTNQLTSLPAKKDDFIGRKKELEEISKKLDKNNLLYVVNGIGGIGKSEISNKYLHDNVNKYDNVAFLQVTENQDIEDLFITKLKEPLKLFGEVNFDSVIQALQQLKGKNLLLIDDLSKIEDFEKIRPISNSFDVLITTRTTTFDTSKKNQLTLNVLTKEEAKELFQEISEIKENVEDILEFLDYHPLMITLTAKSLKLNYISLEELRDTIKNGEISKIESDSDKNFSSHLHEHFSKQLKKEENQELKDLLEVLSIFPPIEIELSVFEKIIDDKRVKIKLQKLVERGWLIQKEKSYKLHQIIKTFLLEENPPTYQKVSSVLENIGDFLDPEDSELIANNFLHYIPFIDSILNQFKDMKNETIAKLLDSLMFLYYAQGEYKTALIYGQKSKEIREKIHGKNGVKTAISLNILGGILDEQGKYDKALSYYEKALVIRESILGLKHPDTATSYNNLALLFYSQGEYDKALPFFEKALEIREYLLGEKHPDTATIYNNLAGLFESQGEYDKALPLYKKALEISESVLGEKHPDTAMSYNNLAELFRSQRDYDKALPLYKKALEISESVLGEKHPKTAISYNNLALLFYSQGEHDKALAFYEKALEIKLKVIGAKHPSTATSYNNLAGLFYSQEKYDKALPLYEKALEIRELVLGEKHPNTIMTSINYQNLLYKMKEKKL